MTQNMNNYEITEQEYQDAKLIVQLYESQLILKTLKEKYTQPTHLSNPPKPPKSRKLKEGNQPPYNSKYE
jgi:hypothetical protein